MRFFRKVSEEEYIAHAVNLAKARVWEGEFPSLLSAHWLAMDSLREQDPDLFEKAPHMIFALLQREHNRWIKKLFRNSDIRTIAFAIRNSLM